MEKRCSSVICLKISWHSKMKAVNEERVVICCVKLVWYLKSITEVQERVKKIQVKVEIGNIWKNNTLPIVEYSHGRIVDLQRRAYKPFYIQKWRFIRILLCV